MIKERITNKKEKNMKQDFGLHIQMVFKSVDDDRMKQIKLRMIDEFKSRC